MQCWLHSYLNPTGKWSGKWTFNQVIFLVQAANEGQGLLVAQDQEISALSLVEIYRQRHRLEIRW